MSIELVRGELERLFSLDEMLVFGLNEPYVLG